MDKIDELKKQSLWPFPEWKDGKKVIRKLPQKRMPKPDWYKEVGEAKF